MYLYSSLADSIGLEKETADFYFGLGDYGWKSDISGLLVSWFFYWIAIHAVYYIGGTVLLYTVQFLYPKHGTNHVPRKIQALHINLSELAFPLYVMVAVCADFTRKKGYSRVCDNVSDCGGYLWSSFNFFLFVMTLELIVFLDHWYLLHVWKWGKKNLKHEMHHRFERADEMNVWTGYAFDPIDGFSQGLGLVICQWIYPVPVQFVLALSGIIGIWTMYIHQGVPHLPWPLMGADYHFVHHKYNWYNFGFFTNFWDYVFGTLKHPRPSDFIVEETKPPKRKNKSHKKKGL